MKQAPKVFQLLWRLCTNSLLSRAFLKFRHLIEDECPKGCGAAEMSEDAMFECPHIVDLWQECCCEEMRTSVPNASMCDKSFELESLDNKVVLMGYFFM